MGETAPIWGLRFDGRMGRLSYATVGAYVAALFLVMALYAIKSPTSTRLVIYLLFSVALVFVMLRWTVLRLHDINFSGWWTPLLLLPYVGAVISLVVSIVPGTAGDNDHGPPPQGGHLLLLAPALVALCVSAWISVPTFMAMAREEAIGEEQPAPDVGRVAAQPIPAPALPNEHSHAGARAAFQGRYLTAREPKAFAVSAGGAWGMSDTAASNDDAVTAAMVDCEVRRQPAAAPCRLINMNGQGNAPQ